MSRVYQPSELSFDLHDDGDGTCGVFICAKDNRELRVKDISVLPPYFEETEAESFWMVEASVEQVNKDLTDLGFTHELIQDED